jgi:AmmeMemoRadiSam system protein B
MDRLTGTRPSSIAGRWYPADPQRLADSVDAYIQAARLPDIPGEVVAVMAPHAGHLYSGPVAGFAFAALEGLEPEIVAVIAPMHYPAPYPLLTTTYSAYATPLGAIEVDEETLHSVEASLQNELEFGLAPVKNDPEHALEIELPFLQRVLPEGFRLLPVMVHDASKRVASALGNALARALEGRRALLVASTDLSHFYPQPVAEALDGEVLRQVEAFDPEAVLSVEEEGKGFACGRGALAAVLWAAKELGANHVQIVRHATSGEITGDYDRVVGYAAAVITRIS